MPTEEQETSPLSLIPEKTPQRLRQEETFLWVWRVILLIASVWLMTYSVMGLVLPAERLRDLATDSPHGFLQFGLTIFVGGQLAYYLYISASFRQCKEWGMYVWLFGLAAMVLNLRFGI